MNEVTRILSKGHFHDDFLQPETICGFQVDENRKKLWLVSLDLLYEIDRVCRKHNLQYTLFFGSLLGAVRHNGFIPWDDDIDIAMPRRDYEVLLTLANEFNEPYFFQSPETDSGYYYTCNKLRNSNTTALSVMFQYEKFNQGMSLDIFPLDYCSSSGVEEKFNRVKELAYDLGTAMRLNNPYLDEANKKRVNSYSGNNPLDTYQLIREICCEESDEESDLLACVSWNVYGPNHQAFNKKMFSSYIDFNMYGINVPIPECYDKILTVLYGDYLKLPPIEKRGTWHSGAIFDMNKPYTEYLKK